MSNILKSIKLYDNIELNFSNNNIEDDFFDLIGTIKNNLKKLDNRQYYAIDVIGNYRLDSTGYKIITSNQWSKEVAIRNGYDIGILLDRNSSINIKINGEDFKHIVFKYLLNEKEETINLADLYLLNNLSKDNSNDEETEVKLFDNIQITYETFEIPSLAAWIFNQPNNEFRIEMQISYEK